jgi:3-oxoacyl-[acyl-carrier-protein] synthase III
MYLPVMRTSAASLALMVVLAGCSAPVSGTPTAQPSPAATVTMSGGLSALRWGDGPYGVVLLHDADHDAAAWATLAHALAADGMTVLAPHATTPEALRTAIQALRSSRQDQPSPAIERVAVIAAGDAIGAVLALAESDPTVIDQVILVSPESDARWTAEFPKLFVAASDSAQAPVARRAEGSAAGQWNALLIVDGGETGQVLFDGAAGAELISAVVRRLDERR